MKIVNISFTNQQIQQVIHTFQYRVHQYQMSQ